MKKHIPINFYGRWRAFYWFTLGKLYVKQDSSYSQTADPCARDTPIFASTSSNVLLEDTLTISGATGELVSHAIVYEGIYVVMTDFKKRIYRIEGVPGSPTKLSKVTFFDFSDTTSFPAFKYFSFSSQISQIVSMEYYGLFVNVDGSKYFLEIEPDKIMAKNPNGTLLYTDPTAMIHSYPATGGALLYDKNALTDTTKTLGIRERDDVPTFCPTATQFKFA